MVLPEQGTQTLWSAKSRTVRLIGPLIVSVTPVGVGPGLGSVNGSRTSFRDSRVGGSRLDQVPGTGGSRSDVDPFSRPRPRESQSSTQISSDLFPIRSV